MEALELYRKIGWTFAIWLVPLGYIIQGSVDGKDHDWDFDVQASSLSDAVWYAILKCRCITDAKQ